VGEACSIHGEDEKYTVLIGKQGKRPLGRCRCVWEDNITMDIREIVWEVVDWFNLDKDKDQWRALANTEFVDQLSDY